MCREKYGVVPGETEDNIIKVSSDEIVEKVTIDSQSSNAESKKESSSDE